MWRIRCPELRSAAALTVGSSSRGVADTQLDGLPAPVTSVEVPCPSDSVLAANALPNTDVPTHRIVAPLRFSVPHRRHTPSDERGPVARWASRPADSQCLGAESEGTQARAS